MAAADISVGPFLGAGVTPGAIASFEIRKAQVAPKAAKGPRGGVPVVVPRPSVPVATPVASRTATVPTAAIVVATAVTRQMPMVSGAFPSPARAIREAPTPVKAATPSAELAGQVVRTTRPAQDPLEPGVGSQVAAASSTVRHALGITWPTAAGEAVLPGVAVAHAAIRPVAAPDGQRRDAATRPRTALALLEVPYLEAAEPKNGVTLVAAP